MPLMPLMPLTSLTYLHLLSSINSLNTQRDEGRRAIVSEFSKGEESTACSKKRFKKEKVEGGEGGEAEWRGEGERGLGESREVKEKLTLSRSESEH